MREIMVSLVYIAYFALIFFLYKETDSILLVLTMLFFIPSFKFKTKDKDKKIM